LTQMVSALSYDGTRVIVLTGAGKAFCAGAGEHDDPGAVVGQRRDHLGELDHELAVERVAGVRAVERDRGHEAVPVEPDAAHIRKTPKVVSGTGPHAAAARPKASTLRVSTGSITPSSQRRAVE